MLSCRFEAKQPYTTWWVSLEYEVGNPEDAADLARCVEQLGTVGFSQHDPLVPELPVGCRHRVELDSQGSGMFKDWTPEERKVKMRAARRVLRDLGFAGTVPKRKLTLADLL